MGPEAGDVGAGLHERAVRSACPIGEERQQEVQPVRLLRRTTRAELARRAGDRARASPRPLVERARRFEERLLVEPALAEGLGRGRLAGSDRCEQVHRGHPLLARRGQVLSELAQRDELGVRAT